MNTKPEKNIASEAIINGAFGVSSAAMYPDRIGGKDCPRVLILELTPRVRPCSSDPTDLLINERKFACTKPKQIAKNGLMKSRPQPVFGAKNNAIHAAIPTRANLSMLCSSNFLEIVVFTKT